MTDPLRLADSVPLSLPLLPSLFNNSDNGFQRFHVHAVLINKESRHLFNDLSSYRSFSTFENIWFFLSRARSAQWFGFLPSGHVSHHQTSPAYALLADVSQPRPTVHMFPGRANTQSKHNWVLFWHFPPLPGIASSHALYRNKYTGLFFILANDLPSDRIRAHWQNSVLLQQRKWGCALFSSRYHPLHRIQDGADEATWEQLLLPAAERVTGNAMSIMSETSLVICLRKRSFQSCVSFMRALIYKLKQNTKQEQIDIVTEMLIGAVTDTVCWITQKTFCYTNKKIK